ncbi:hypothetical protein D3C86_1434440 [compost metagenome]
MGCAFVGVEPTQSYDLARHAQAFGRAVMPPGFQQRRTLRPQLGHAGPEGGAVDRDDVRQGPDQHVGVDRAGCDDHLTGQIEAHDLATSVLQHGAACGPALEDQSCFIALRSQDDRASRRMGLQHPGEAVPDIGDVVGAKRPETGQHPLKRRGVPGFVMGFRLILHGLRPTAWLRRFCSSHRLVSRDLARGSEGPGPDSRALLSQAHVGSSRLRCETAGRKTDAATSPGRAADSWPPCPRGDREAAPSAARLSFR